MNVEIVEYSNEKNCFIKLPRIGGKEGGEVCNIVI